MPYCGRHFVRLETLEINSLDTVPSTPAVAMVNKTVKQEPHAKGKCTNPELTHLEMTIRSRDHPSSLCVGRPRFNTSDGY